MMSHTSGPWETSGIRISGLALSKERLLQVNAPNGGVAWVIYSDLKPGDHQQSHADQRLIAAAPDGLVLARMIVKYFGDGPINPLLDCDIALRDAARSLIAKATGGAP
jgi:hypothetical protein